MKATLMLEDGHSFRGQILDDNKKEAIGEAILNTAVVGYQEMMTDPANAGKILILTYPLIGNYGTAPKFNESKRVWLAGMVIKEKSRIYSNWQAKSSFDDFIKENKLPVITGIDTRTLAVHLRQKGEMLGIISAKTADPKELLAKLANFRKKEEVSLLPNISIEKPRVISQKAAKNKVVILDLGLTNSLIRQLETLGLTLIILPYNTKAQEILKLKPKGLIISSGPEADLGLKEVVSNVKNLVGKLPILGIACGHQVLARALGAEVSKMKLGHRGVNYPMHNPSAYKAEITVQNHGYVVGAGSLSRIKNIKITGYNLNDHTVEEMESARLKLLGIQYIPASPGFAEANDILKKFAKILKRS